MTIVSRSAHQAYGIAGDVQSDMASRFPTDAFRLYLLTRMHYKQRVAKAVDTANILYMH